AWTWRLRTASVSARSRSSSLSPTHRIGTRPASRTAGTLRASASSVSPKYWRRSECPTIAPHAPTSTSIGGETSPVNAPEASKWTFWAATTTGDPPHRSITTGSAVNGGQIATSTPVRPAACGRKASRNSRACPRVLFIFQFAATRGVRSGIIERLHPRQVSPLHELQRGATAGREPIDFVGEAEARERRRRVTSANDREARCARHRLRDPARPGGERLQLER